MEPVFFDSWSNFARMIVCGTFGYVGLVIMLRASGKRSLAKLNMFDLVVTVALGSLLAAVMTSNALPLSEGLGAIGLLLVLQWLATFTASRFSAVDDVIKSEPTLLFHDGRMLHGAMKRERVAESEIYSAARDSSIGDLDRVKAMVLESDGTISVIPKDQSGDGSTLPSRAAD